MRLLGAVLLLGLGLARGVGGLLLLTGTSGLEPEIDRGNGLAGTMLVLVGIVAVAAAIGVWRRRRWGIGLGVAACVLFVVGGVVNGFLLFGAPRPAGLVGNLGVAGAIVLVLSLQARRVD